MKGEKKRGVRLQVKLAGMMVLLMLSVMAAVGIYLVARVSVYYENAFRAQMQNVFTADTLSTLRESAAESVTALRDMVSAYSGRLGVGAGTDRDFFILDGRTGAVLEGGSHTGAGSVAFTNNVLAALSGEAGFGNRITDDCFDAAVPVEAGRERYVVYVRDDRTSTNELVAMLITVVLQAILFGLLIAVGISYILAKTLTRPIEGLTRGASRVAEGRFGADLPVRSGDEIGDLTENFNHMARTLERSMDDLNSEKNKYSALLVYMTDGVISFDASGRAEHINPTAREMLGCKEDAPGFDEIFGDSGITPEQVLSLPANEHAETELARGGAVLQVILSPTGSIVGERGIVAVVHDVTKERALEESRRKFVADISHELRTPLTNIKGYAETIAGDEAMPVPVRRRFLGVVQNEADRMLRIVQDLLTLSRMDNRSMSWKFEWVDLEESLESVNTAMQMRAGEKKHRLSLRMQGTLPLVWCDKERLEQVVVNLITNAVNYTPEGGEISVAARREGNDVYISVRDNGIGIPEENLGHLFDRFYRVDKARSRESGGTGLGLAITYEIVQKHHGEISVESRVGEGSVFTVRIPVDSGEERTEE